MDLLGTLNDGESAHYMGYLVLHRHGRGEEDFDLEKLRYHKIVLMADADVGTASTSPRCCSPSSSAT